MYLPRQFREDRTDVLHAAIRDYPMAQLVTFGTAGLEATPLPLLLDLSDSGGQGHLLGHVARANPQWKTTDQSVEALAIFSGPDGYVSPGWYETKRQTGKVVPTWNYVTIQVRGRISFFDDAAGLLDIVRRLTERHEDGRDAPWAVADAPADFIASQLRAIVGLRLEITEITGKWKMSQNRSEADRAGVIEGLRSEGNPGADAVAEAVATAMTED
ncbi:FMN-binding negative transcriptional regulator [Acidisoma cellulosilytica]|uniref:FMN-binding negative transcriptional regulator n=1 Tax=Acidisoma cellulosilyticum TaxID=2802395 RepID=A0A964E2K4_9PROT|nr:FMN-binding negative transcriptional regulator [Acidisoma cellulosilyticum]MCB8879511.1 FMN-binding negative transcriptional regulator [Acidisoma cellulosilyticum]